MSNGIDPRTALAINAAAMVASLVAAGSLLFPGVPDPIVSLIKGYAADLTVLITGLNLIFHWYSAPTPGPGVK